MRTSIKASVAAIAIALPVLAGAMSASSAIAASPAAPHTVSASQTSGSGGTPWG